MAKGSKLSKMAANRLAVSGAVLSSAEVHGAQLAKDLHATLFPAGPHKPELTEKFVDALGQLLDRAAQEVKDSDLAHSAELLDDEEPRQRRDGLCAELSAALLGLRDTLTGLYGADTARAYALSDALPQLPTQLVQRARIVETLLRKQPLPSRPQRAGVTVKAAALADELSPLIDQLGVALDDVQRESREAQLSLERKTRAAEAWQRTYQGVTSAFYGLYLLAGRKDLAERIEPTARRRAGIPEDGDPNPPEPTLPGSPPAAPTPAWG